MRQFDFDKLGRPTQDRVTTFTTGVDDAVKRIGRAYEVRGMLQTVTSYDNATVGRVHSANPIFKPSGELANMEPSQTRR